MEIRKVKVNYVNGYFEGTIIVAEGESIGDVVSRRLKLPRRVSKTIRIVENRKGSLYDIPLSKITPEEFDTFLKEFEYERVS